MRFALWKASATHLTDLRETRTFERDGARRQAMTIPCGDVYTAYVSTGIHDIEVYTTAPPKAIARMRRLRLLGPLLRTQWLQRWLKAKVERSVPGPCSALKVPTCSS